MSLSLDNELVEWANSSKYLAPVSASLSFLFLVIFLLSFYPSVLSYLPNLSLRTVIQIFSAVLTTGMFLLALLSYVSDEPQSSGNAGRHLHFHSRWADDDTIEEIAEAFTNDEVSDRIKETSSFEAFFRQVVMGADERDIQNEEQDSASYSTKSEIEERESKRFTPGDTPPVDFPQTPNISIEFDKLESLELIARGGSAEIYKSRTQIDGEDYQFAIKTPRFGGTISREFVQRFVAEVEVWRELDSHPHIVNLIDWGTDPIPWIAMEYMDGGSLNDYAGSVQINHGIWIAQKVVSAIIHAHRRGVIHRDIKPANILFRETAENQWNAPKVSDWGLAGMLLEQNITMEEEFTLQFAAPEQIDKDRHGQLDYQTDIYQLGATFYQLFTGEAPFHGSSVQVLNDIMNLDPTPPSEIRESIPPELNRIILDCLAKDQSERYEDALYLRDDLEELYHEWG